MDTIDFTKIDFTIKVILPSGKEIDINPIAQLVINEDDIRKEVRELPAQYALFGSLYVQYKKNRDILNYKLNELKTKYEKKIREENGDLKNKEVEVMVDSMDDVKTLSQNLIHANYYVNQLYHLLEGLEKKQKSLTALGYMNAREERVNDEFTKSKLLNNSTDIAINPNRYAKNV